MLLHPKSFEVFGMLLDLLFDLRDAKKVDHTLRFIFMLGHQVLVDNRQGALVPRRRHPLRPLEVEVSNSRIGDVFGRAVRNTGLLARHL